MGGFLTSAAKLIARRLFIEGRHVCLFIPQAVLHALRHRALPLKHRHVYTRSGRLRLRYVALMAATFMGFASSNLSLVSGGLDVAPAYANINVASAEAAIEPAAGITASGADFIEPVADPLTAMMAAPVEAPAPVTKPEQAVKPELAPAKPLLANYSRNLTIKSGDTLSDVIASAAIEAQRASDAIAALKGHINPKELKAGQNVTMHYSWASGAGERLTAMEFSPTPLTQVVLSQGANGAFKVQTIEKPLKEQVRAARATIRSSLYGDLRAAGVPDSIIAQFIKTYSYNVDFQRDIWAGDKVELLYDVSHTEDNEFVKGGDLIYAALYLRGKPSVIFRFENGGTAEYFDDKGNPIRKALMRTPIDGARVTSGFGMRHHPILGYNRMHKGMDFGAPTGTPIFAAGDGKVETAGWAGAYGKMVVIRHNGTYQTAYAHMSALSVKPGQRVKQGQVIGRVGTTGRSTGPHLHFEVRQSGNQVNPSKIASMSVGARLSGRQMNAFKASFAAARSSVDTITAAAAKPRLASLSSGDQSN